MDPAFPGRCPGHGAQARLPLAAAPGPAPSDGVSKSLKHIGIVSFLTVVSRVLGLIRDQVAAALFGTSVLYSAWLWAFSLPNLFRRLLAEGSLTAAFIPTIQEEIHDRGQEGAYSLLSNVASWLLVASSGIVAVAMVAFSQSRLIEGAEKWHLGADLAVILFPYLCFICLAAAFNAMLNVMHRFTEPALSPIWLNLAMIGSLAGAGLHFAKTPMGELRWLSAGVLLGGFFQMAVPAAVLMAAGWRPRFDLTLSPWVRKIARMMGPGLFGTAIYQINITVSRTLAFHVSDSGTTLLFNSNRLMELPIGVFAIAVSTVVYPLIARHAVENNLAKMGEDFRKGLRLILVINVPAAVGLALLSHPIVRLLYQRGAWTAADSASMATLVALFAIGLPFFSVVNLTVRAFYAVKDTATPVRVAAIDFVVNVVLSLVLMRWLGLAGLVVASTTAIIVQTVLLERALRRKLPGLTLVPLIPSAAKVVAAAAIMAAGLWIGLALVGRSIASTRLGDIVCVFALIPAGIALYGACLWAFRIEGRDDLEAVVARVFRSKRT